MAEDFDSLVELLRRTTDENGWLQPLLADQDSAVVVGAIVTVFARLGPAVDHNGAQATISGASGGSPGTSSLTATRATSGTTGTVPQGYVFADARGCQAFLTVPIVVGSGDTSITLPLQTLRQTELVNTEDDPGFGVDPGSAILTDGSGGILMAPASLFLADVRVVATTNQALTGTPTIDGVTVGAFDRVLCVGQTASSQNGVYVLPSGGGAWTRALDLSTAAAFVPGLMVPVDQGTTHAGQLWQLTTTGPIVLGTTALAFLQVGLTATVFRTLGPATPIQGGAADFLSVHGGERGILRQPGEDTEAYRQRVRNIPDAVSPIAIADVVQAAAQQPGLPGFLTLEPFDDGASVALKTLHGLGSFLSYYLDDPGGAREMGFLDDPLAGEVLVDRRTATAYMQIQAQGFITDASASVFFVDDGFLDDPVLGYPDLASGVPADVLARLLAIWADVQAKKGGGVNFDIVLEPPVDEVGAGQTSGDIFAEVITLTPPANKIWAVLEGQASHNASDPAASVIHHVVFDFEDGSHLTTADFSSPWSERLPATSKRVTAVHGFLQSNGSVTAHLVVALKVLEMTT